jgi:hypothetical protein
MKFEKKLLFIFGLSLLLTLSAYSFTEIDSLYTEHTSQIRDIIDI